jgi:hypothetical protein
MLLDRAQGDDQAVGDLLIRAPGRDQAQHLDLPFAQRLDQMLRA